MRTTKKRKGNQKNNNIIKKSNQEEEVEPTKEERIKAAAAEIKKRRLKARKSICINCYPIRKDVDWESLSRSSSAAGDAVDDASSVSSAASITAGIGAVSHPHSGFSYHRLPYPQIIRLSVLKLDQTSFEVKIATAATVAELKTAVEDVFQDGGNISWTHVWGHFCLCYEGYKLIDTRACLKDYGIKDGDQLRFVRHLQINSCPIKKQPRNREAVAEQNMMRLTWTEEGTELDEYNHNNKNDDNSSSRDEQYRRFDGDNQVARKELKLAHVFQSWLSYCKLGYLRKSDRTPKPGKYF